MMMMMMRRGVGKSGVLEHKSGNISETRKDKGKVTMESLQEVTNALSNDTYPTPYALSFPKIGSSQPHPKTAITIMSGTAKATDFKFGHTFTGSIRTQAHEKFLRKGAYRRIQGLPKFF